MNISDNYIYILKHYSNLNDLKHKNLKSEIILCCNDYKTFLIFGNVNIT